ncbi:MAG: dimethyl sulfoxide reductase anchor subunit [Pseudomonadota bacterium]|nr:dimethyl sulfoxide reductase anchor subunit [Pseudomonadota bacterium]
MTQKYATGVRFADHFGVLETLSFWGEGVGAGLYIAAVLAGAPVLEALGIAFVGIAVLALLAHLGNPQRSWRAVRKLGNAWVSRGTLMIGLFFGFAAAGFVCGYVAPVASFSPLLKLAAFACALPVLIYAGMLLRSMRAIRLWGGPFLPFAFGLQALASGFTAVWAYAAWFAPAPPSWLQPAALGAVVLCTAFSALHVTTTGKSAGIRASLARLLSGDLRGLFVLGGGLFGVAVPLLVLAAAQANLEDSAALATVAALCRLYGDFAYRNAIVRAGAYEPVVPTVPSALFRKSAATQ